MSKKFEGPVAKEVSDRMRRVSSKNTQPELLVRKELHREGLRFRINANELPGKPDIVLPKHKVAVFVHGCFWHRHEGCRYATTPKIRTDFWEAKFSYNKDRDKAALENLHAMGWRPIVVWTCELKKAVLGETISRLVQDVKNGASS